jgi:hypothetical protein
MRLETDLGISIDIGIDIELRARTPLLRHPLDATHLLQHRVRAPYYAHLAQLRHRVTLPTPRGTRLRSTTWRRRWTRSRCAGRTTPSRRRRRGMCGLTALRWGAGLAFYGLGMLSAAVVLVVRFVRCCEGLGERNGAGRRWLWGWRVRQRCVI